MAGPEAVERHVGDVAEARDEPPAEQVEAGEDELGGAVGVGGVDLGCVVGEDDRVEGVQAFAFGDGDDLAAEVRVLLVDPDHPRHHPPAIARLAGSEPRERAAADDRVALPIG